MLAESIIAEIAARYGVSVTELKGRSRKREVAEARKWAAIILREYTDLPLKAIGLLLGGRHHSTVHNMLYPKRRTALRDLAAKAQGAR